MLNLRPPVPGAAVKVAEAGVRPLLPRHSKDSNATQNTCVNSKRNQTFRNWGGDTPEKGPGKHTHMVVEQPTPASGPPDTQTKVHPYISHPGGELQEGSYLPPSDFPRLCRLTLHAVPQLLALLGLGRLTVGMWPIGLACRGPRLAVLCGWSCSRLRPTT